MAKIDEVKESIGYFKLIFSILVAINISLVAWLYKNSELLNLIDMVSFLSLVTSVTICIIYINRQVLSKIRSLRDL